MAICIIIGVSKKVWGYTVSVEPSEASNMLEGKLLESFTYIQIFALASIKFSALLFYHRIFSDKSGINAFDTAKTTMMVLVGLWALVMFLLNSLQCGTHITALWTSPENNVKYCTKISPKYTQASALSNVLLDVLILALPLPKIFSLHTTTGRKIAISSVFLLAAVGLGASIARTDAIWAIIHGLISPNADFHLADSLQVFWSMLEAGVSLLAINLPSLWRYKSHISPDSLIRSIRSAISLRSSASNHSRGSNSNTNISGMQPLPGDGQSLHSSAAKAQFVPRVPGQNSETYATYDTEAQTDHAGKMPDGVIMVNSSIVQQDNGHQSPV